MKRLTTAWKLALGSLALTALVLTMTMWVAPPGKLHGRAAGTLHELIENHLDQLDQRLYQMDASGQAPDACEFTWHDQQRVGFRLYAFEATFQLADFDPLREDWVVTCSPDAQYYALELESDFTGSLTPRLDRVVMHRNNPPETTQNTLN